MTFLKHHFSFLERLAIFEAYGRTCVYCGNIVEWKDFEVDHVINEGLQKEPQRLRDLIEDYGLGSNFQINAFANWACSHRLCNRQKNDTTFDKSRALHYLSIAEKKAVSTSRIEQRLQRDSARNKVLAVLRTSIENGRLSVAEIADFANSVVCDAGIGPNNPALICFGLLMEDVYNDFPIDGPSEPPYIYDWLESKLAEELHKKLQGKVEPWEEDRNGETLSIRFALWDLDLEALDTLELRWWEITELVLHTDLYGEFVSENR